MLFLYSCGSFTSSTEIESKKSFVLGNNEHKLFHIKVKNLSNEPVTLFHEPITGGSHSPQTINSNETIKVKVDKNTALKIVNSSNQKVIVGLKISGDTGLSMGYIN